MKTVVEQGDAQVGAQVDGETPQVDGETPQVNNSNLKGAKKSPEFLQAQILQFCNEPRTTVEIVVHLGLKDRKGVRNRGIAPLLKLGRLAMTIPDKPNSRFQKYITIK